MNRERVLELLKENENEIKKFGVRRIGIFGSFARDEGREDSDVDIFVEFEGGKGTFKNFAGLVTEKSAFHQCLHLGSRYQMWGFIMRISNFNIHGGNR